MASVYLDPSAILLAGANDVARQAAPGASEALRSLTEVVDDVVVLAPESLAGVIELPAGVRVAPALPDSPGAGSWFVTADPEAPLKRPAGVTTLLVGPRRTPGPVPLPRFDVEARDLPAAVIEILTREAMG